MKIYTKTGDTGETSLANGMRIMKNDRRVELYGTVDELNSCIGFAISFMEHDEKGKQWIESLTTVQNILFELGSELAGFTTDEPAITNADIQFLEDEIDRWESRLSPLTNFIIPGGSRAASALHVARTIARKLERMLCAAIQESFIKDEHIPYCNRLSDYLFVAARFANHIHKNPDRIWKSRKR